MEELENKNELPRLTFEEFNEIGNSENPTEDPVVLAFMEKAGLTFETGGVAKVTVDGETKFFVTDPKDFGTVLEDQTIAERGLE